MRNDEYYQKENLNKFKTRPEWKRKSKKDDFFAACYAMYLTGKSLEQIVQLYKNQFTAQNLFQSFKRRGWKLRYSPTKDFIVYKGIKYTARKVGGYKSYRSGITQERLHRVIYAEHFGPPPLLYVIIHKDGNRENNDPINLKAIPRKKIRAYYENL